MALARTLHSQCSVQWSEKNTRYLTVILIRSLSDRAEGQCFLLAGYLWYCAKLLSTAEVGIAGSKKTTWTVADIHF
jgi:hypothetical protein